MEIWELGESIQERLCFGGPFLGEFIAIVRRPYWRTQQLEAAVGASLNFGWEKRSLRESLASSWNDLAFGRVETEAYGAGGGLKGRKSIGDGVLSASQNGVVKVREKQVEGCVARATGEGARIGCRARQSVKGIPCCTPTSEETRTPSNRRFVAPLGPPGEFGATLADLL